MIIAVEQARALEQAAGFLRGGDIVVYPTETVYGLGVDGGSASALAALIALKGREAARGISLLVADRAMAERVAGAVFPAVAAALAEAFWPGPLTIVVPPAPGAVDSALLGPSGGVGFRCADDPVASALVRAGGLPVTSTSANPSGSPAAETAAQAQRYFGDGVACYLDGGRRAEQAASTVVEVVGDVVYLRREGVLARSRIEQLCTLSDD